MEADMQRAYVDELKNQTEKPRLEKAIASGVYFMAFVGITVFPCWSWS
jgi:hypothetical protein